MKFSSTPKKRSAQKLRIRSSSNERQPGRRPRQSAISHDHDHAVGALDAACNDKSVTIENQTVRRIMEQKHRNLVAYRNKIIAHPGFANHLINSFENSSKSSFEASAERNFEHEPETFEGNSEETLAAIDQQLDDLEHHLDGDNHLAHRLGRTEQMLARVEQDLENYQRILEETS